jgi:pimeloyl-ACP methyl ester carboxylesterase
MQSFTSHHAVTFYLPLGRPLEGAPLHIIWGHGWAQNHTVFLGLAAALQVPAAHTLLDFPGFGRSPPPPFAWATADYADGISAWLDTVPRQRRIWVSHSFGCRVGLQLAARRPDCVDGLFLISAAGLPPSRTLLQRCKLASKVAVFKLFKAVAGLGFDPKTLQDRLGSADYRNAGPLRPILVKAVNEDLTEVARRVRCPVKLLYGARDTDTPPEIGRRLASLIANAEFDELPRFDHQTILSLGAHQLQHQLSHFIRRLSP